MKIQVCLLPALALLATLPMNAELVDISTALSSCKVSVTSLNSHCTADGFAIFHLTLSVTDSKQLDQVMRKIHQISSVMKVNRPAG